MQLSAVAGSQAMQAPPFAPQAPKPGDVQAWPEQQPLVHDVWLHTQEPLTHCCPLPHAAFTPHWHAPMLLQLLAVKVLHTTHAEPPNPHESMDRWLHVGPEQQPVVHVAAQPVHAPDAQLSPFGQLAQALPPEPQAPSVLPAWHAVPAQQPVGHETPSQTQVPLRQR